MIIKPFFVHCVLVLLKWCFTKKFNSWQYAMFGSVFYLVLQTVHIGPCFWVETSEKFLSILYFPYMREICSGCPICNVSKCDQDHPFLCVCLKVVDLATNDLSFHYVERSSNLWVAWASLCKNLVGFLAVMAALILLNSILFLLHLG